MSYNIELAEKLADMGVNSLAIKDMAGLLTPYDAYSLVNSYRDWETDRKSTRLNSSHSGESRMPSSA